MVAAVAWASVALMRRPGELLTDCVDPVELTDAGAGAEEEDAALGGG